MSTNFSQGRKILIVDDDACARKICERYLSRSGLTCLLATDGSEAIMVYRESIVLGQISCLITDVRMPIMDGFTLVDRVRGFKPDLPVIFLTGETQDRRLAQETVIEKPMVLKELLRIVQTKTDR